MGKNTGRRSHCRCCLGLSATVSVCVCAVAILVSVKSSGGCSSDSDCQDVGNGWTQRCYLESCYVTKADSRCLGKADFTNITPDTFCMQGKAVKKSALRMGLLQKLHLRLEAGLGPPRYWSVWQHLFPMWMFPSNPQHQMVGCQVLSNYGWNDPASKEVMMGYGAAELALGAVLRFRGHFELEHQCLNSLAALSLFNHKVSVHVGQLGVVEVTMDFWKRYSYIPKLNVANFFGCYQDYVPENRERMREAGAIDMMLNISGKGGSQFDDPGSQFSTWCGFSSFHTQANHAHFMKLGGLETSTIVFREHAKSYRVREEILQTMLGVCASRAARQELVRLGYFEELTEAMREDARDPQVVALGLQVLRIFIDGNETMRGRFLALGGVGIATEALETHAAKLLNTRDSGQDSQNVYGNLNDEMYNVPGAASEVIYSLALDAAGRRVMLEAGVAHKLVEAIQATAHRIPSVRHRTKLASCQTLLQLETEVQVMKATEDGAPSLVHAPKAVKASADISALIQQGGCSVHKEHPKMIVHGSYFEP